MRRREKWWVLHIWSSIKRAHLVLPIHFLKPTRVGMTISHLTATFSMIAKIQFSKKLINLSNLRIQRPSMVSNPASISTSKLNRTSSRSMSMRSTNFQSRRRLKSSTIRMESSRCSSHIHFQARPWKSSFIQNTSRNTIKSIHQAQSRKSTRTWSFTRISNSTNKSYFINNWLRTTAAAARKMKRWSPAHFRRCSSQPTISMTRWSKNKI